MQVLIDGYDDEGRVIARSSADAPEIDGTVIIEASADQLVAGEFAEVTVTDAGDYDLWAKPVGL